MKNDNSLMPNSVKSILKNYKQSLTIIFQNKRLLAVVILFIATQIFILSSAHIYQKLLFKNLYSYSDAFQATKQPFTEAFSMAFNSINWLNIISSLSLLAIFNLLSVVILFFVFYKHFSKLTKLPTVRKINFCSAIFFILGLSLGVSSYLYAKNLPVIFLSTLVCSFSLGFLVISLVTLIEGVCISFVKSLLLENSNPTEEVFANSGKFFKPLFLFNIIFAFVAPATIANIGLLPNILNSFVLNEPGNSGNFIPISIYSVVIGTLLYFRTFFVAIFIFIPFILAMNHTDNLLGALSENLKIIKGSFSKYVALILSGIILMGMLSLIMEFFIPSSAAVSTPSLIKNIISTCLKLFFLIIFFITTFTYTADYYNKER